MTPAEAPGFARGLLAEMRELRSAYQELQRDFAALKVDHQAVKDELARLKKLPPRPPLGPSRLEKATSKTNSEGKSGDREDKKQGRGPLLDRLKITSTVLVPTEAPLGSKRKGYEERPYRRSSPDPIPPENA